jgi:hypothetical protein
LLETDGAVSIELHPEQGRDEVPAEEKEDAEPEVPRNERAQPGVGREHDQERESADPVERGDVKSTFCCCWRDDGGLRGPGGIGPGLRRCSAGFQVFGRPQCGLRTGHCQNTSQRC